MKAAVDCPADEISPVLINQLLQHSPDNSEKSINRSHPKPLPDAASFVFHYSNISLQFNTRTVRWYWCLTSLKSNRKLPQMGLAQFSLLWISFLSFFFFFIKVNALFRLWFYSGEICWACMLFLSSASHIRTAVSSHHHCHLPSATKQHHKYISGLGCTDMSQRWEDCYVLLKYLYWGVPLNLPIRLVYGPLS